MRLHLFWILIFCSATLYAKEVTLYACTIDGHTTLESTTPQHCDVLKEYRYTLNDSQKGSSLRPEEIRQLEQMQGFVPSRSSEIRRYEQIDSRIGSIIVSDYRNTLHDKCAYYQAKLDSLLATLGAQEPYEFDRGSQYIPTIDHGDVRTQQLNIAAHKLQSQVNYYCR